MPSTEIVWSALRPTSADRIRKLCGTDEFILIHEERRKPNFGRATDPDEGTIRIHYDPVEFAFYREVAFNNQPSTWTIAMLPPHPDDVTPEDD